MDTDIYKSRNAGGCVKAASRLFATNLKTVFLRTWLPALVLAAVCSLMIFVADAPQVSWLYIAKVVAFVIMTLAASVWFYTKVIGLLNGNGWRRNLPRVTRMTLLLAGVFAVYVALAFGASLLPFSGMTEKSDVGRLATVSGCITIAAYVVLAIVALPLTFSTMDYLMDGAARPDGAEGGRPKRVWTVIGRSYCTGWKHWGYLFLTAFICMIISAIVQLVVYLPAIIMHIAKAIDAYGQALGDAPGLPQGFMPLAYCVLTLCVFIATYVGVWQWMVFYYAWGSITAKRERKG